MTTRRRRGPRAISETPIPIGTRLADIYGMDLDREVREGIAGGRYGVSKHEPEREVRGWTGRTTIMAVIAAVVGAMLLYDRFAFRARLGSLNASYPDYAGAASALAFQQGLVPRFLPRDATDIRVEKNRATGEAWIAFGFRPQEDRSMVERLQRLSLERMRGLRVRGPESTWWWPRDLRGVVSEATWEVFSTGGGIRGVAGPEYLAVDWGRRRACLWREMPAGSRLYTE